MIFFSLEFRLWGFSALRFKGGPKQDRDFGNPHTGIVYIDFVR